MSTAAFFFHSLDLKMLHLPFKSSVKKLWFWHIWLPLKPAFKPLYTCPSSHRNTCFKFVCMPLPSFSSLPSISSTWSLGMFTLKLVFQDSSSFLSSQLSFLLSESLPCHLCTLSVCTSVSFFISGKRIEHPESKALVALMQARPGCRGVM